MKKFILTELNSFKHAFNGLGLLLKEKHFIVHLLLALTAIVIGIIQKTTTLEWLIIITCIMVVLVAEAINTAIEKTVNYISLEIHPEAKKIKDIAAGMVLITAVFSLIIGVIIFLF